MAFATLERSAPPFFRQGPSAAARLVFFASLSVLLMALDTRWHLLGPLRQGLDLALAPVTQVARAPLLGLRGVAQHFESLEQTRDELARQQRLNVQLALQAQQARDLERQNTLLRELLRLQASVPVRATAAKIVAQARDPFSRKLVLDKGHAGGI